MASANNIHQDKIKRLKVYLEKCERDASNITKTQVKRDFFTREIKKTKSALEKLTIG